ncbi:MAG: hypothetical protein KGM92_05950, partial [Acidobacteriota bacterium]|nr:hypothetical protein [Acidobacteriota bacterium]
TVSNCFWRAAAPIYSPFVRPYSIYTDPRQMSTFAFEKEHFDGIQTRSTTSRSQTESGLFLLAAAPADAPYWEWRSIKAM